MIDIQMNKLTNIHIFNSTRIKTVKVSQYFIVSPQGACAALRRQKELELQVVTGEVRGWPGGELTSLGDVLHMGSVAVGPSHQDRYLVLFPSALLLLSVSKRVSAFVYEVSEI